MAISCLTWLTVMQYDKMHFDKVLYLAQRVEIVSLEQWLGALHIKKMAIGLQYITKSPASIVLLLAWQL